MTRRAGVTLLELLIVVSIIALLIAMLVVAVVRVRETAARTQSENKLRTIILGAHLYADAHEKNLPTVDGNYAPKGGYGPSLPIMLLPYVDQGDYNALMNAEFVTPVLQSFISPADPTAAAAMAVGESISSYAANGCAFIDNPRFPMSFSDGTSNTIAFAEHYGYECNRTTFVYTIPMPGFPIRRASFADAGAGDVVPITSGKPPVTASSDPPLTFQVAPSLAACDSRIAQTPHASGMLVALMDGSVRTLAPNMSEQTFWAAVTPAGADPLGDDW